MNSETEITNVDSTKAAVQPNIYLSNYLAGITSKFNFGWSLPISGHTRRPPDTLFQRSPNVITTTTGR